jgi:hypothetical protein
MGIMTKPASVPSATAEQAKRIVTVLGFNDDYCNFGEKVNMVVSEMEAYAASVVAERDAKIARLESYVESLPANWHEDSSLETWFPITAEELVNLKGQGVLARQLEQIPMLGCEEQRKRRDRLRAKMENLPAKVESRLDTFTHNGEAE